MTKLVTNIEKNTKIDSEGNEQTTILERTTKISKSTEPDYIKLYTNMWCEFNNIPPTWRSLFLELVTRMTYCNSNKEETSQIVLVVEPISTAIRESLGWSSRDMLMKGLKALCECEAIRKVSRGAYQINPNYASKGEWKYNPTYDRGGVEDLVATFKFKDKTVTTEIVWSTNEQETAQDTNPINEAYREGLNIQPNEKVTLKTQTITNKTETPDNNEKVLEPKTPLAQKVQDSNIPFISTANPNDDYSMFNIGVDGNENTKTVLNVKDLLDTFNEDGKMITDDPEDIPSFGGPNPPPIALIDIKHFNEYKKLYRYLYIKAGKIKRPAGRLKTKFFGTNFDV